MKRSIAPIVLAAALIALPASGFAQTPPQQPPAQPPTTQPQPPATPPATQQPPAQPPATHDPAQHGSSSAAEHLSKAKAALNDIETTSVTGSARTRLSELKRHIAALDRAVAGPAAPASSRAKAKAPVKSWATDVAAIDRILTELTTPATSAGDPAATAGTTGTTASTGRTTRPQSAITVDEATRAKLLEVRTHITAFASAMSGTEAAPAPASATPSAAPTATTPPATQPPATTQPPPATQPPTTQPPTSQPPATPPTTTQPPGTQPPATTQPPAATQPPADPSTAGTTGNVDQEAARRHLTEARDILSQLTQLPEAAQLSGDARTQVTELIANFNELITTQAEWRASYGKVQANLTALVGAERTDEANVPPPATGTAGAVGTSGMTTIDPKVREKLIAFRAKLTAFEKKAAEGGGK